jgi:hypothetical protein
MSAQTSRPSRLWYWVAGAVMVAAAGWLVEGPGADDEQVTIPPFTVSLVSVDGDQDVPIRPYGSSLTYNVAGHAGRAVGTFRIDQPGRFVLQADSALEDAQADVAVGHSIGIGIDIPGPLLRTLPAAFLLLLGGAAVAVVVAVRRHRAQAADQV